MRILSVALIAGLACTVLAAIPTEKVPLENIKGAHWELTFKFRTPQRVVASDEKGQEKAYWCLLYTAINKDKVAHKFIPQAVLFTNTGKVIGDGIYPQVVEAVKDRYRLAKLHNSVEIMGELKAGEDEAQDGVLVFPEVDPQMDRFKIFVTGLSGEFVVRELPPKKEGEEPKEIVLRKTLQLNFDFPGDTIDLSADKVYLREQKWVWR